MTLSYATAVSQLIEHKESIKTQSVMENTTLYHNSSEASFDLKFNIMGKTNHNLVKFSKSDQASQGFKTVWMHVGKNHHDNDVHRNKASWGSKCAMEMAIW